MDHLPSSTTNPAETQLIARFGRHDPAAAGEVFERFGTRLFGLILNVVGDPQTAEDLLAEVLLVASNNLHGFQNGNLDFGTWLLILARNHALRFRGDLAASKERAQFWKALEAIAVHEGSSDGGSEYQPSAAASKVFQALPEVNRLVLELAWFEGMSLEEIASHMHVPVSEVMALAASSLARLREC